MDVILHSTTNTVLSSTFRTTDVTGDSCTSWKLVVEMVMPGDNLTVNVKLNRAGSDGHVGLRFAIREGGRTVGGRSGDRNYRLIG